VREVFLGRRVDQGDNRPVEHDSNSGVHVHCFRRIGRERLAHLKKANGLEVKTEWEFGHESGRAGGRFANDYAVASLPLKMGNRSEQHGAIAKGVLD